MALLKHAEAELLSTSDFIELSQRLQQLGRGMWSADTLLTIAYKQIANSSAASRKALAALQQLQQTARGVGTSLVDAVREVRLREGLVNIEGPRTKGGGALLGSATQPQPQVAAPLPPPQAPQAPSPPQPLQSQQPQPQSLQQSSPRPAEWEASSPPSPLQTHDDALVIAQVVSPFPGREASEAAAPAEEEAAAATEEETAVVAAAAAMVVASTVEGCTTSCHSKDASAAANSETTNAAAATSAAATSPAGAAAADSSANGAAAVAPRPLQLEHRTLSLDRRRFASPVPAESSSLGAPSSLGPLVASASPRGSVRLELTGRRISSVHTPSRAAGVSGNNRHALGSRSSSAYRARVTRSAMGLCESGGGGGSNGGSGSRGTSANRDNDGDGIARAASSFSGLRGPVGGWSEAMNRVDAGDDEGDDLLHRRSSARSSSDERPRSSSEEDSYRRSSGEFTDDEDDANADNETYRRVEGRRLRPRAAARRRLSRGTAFGRGDGGDDGDGTDSWQASIRAEAQRQLVRAEALRQVEEQRHAKHTEQQLQRTELHVQRQHLAAALVSDSTQLSSSQQYNLD